jgi:non-canonical purine NTP pyrophosphatase (RdgB/HAM1 family)
MSLLFVTGNPGKLAEARRLWPGRLDSVEIDLPEIQSLDVREVLAAKGEEARKHLAEHAGRPFVVEETSLEIDAFGGFPGPLVKWMLDALGAAGIARAARAAGRESGGSRAFGVTARCLLLVLDGERELVAEGRARGTIVEPRGDRGFGWDPIFLPEGETQTYGELPEERKLEISHRARAWEELGRLLHRP